MTEMSLQIWHNNSSEGFLSNPLATRLQKFAGGVQKQQLPLSFPCTPACWIQSLTQRCRVTAAHRELQSLLVYAHAWDTCMRKHQGLKDSLAGQVSSVLQGSHARVALPSVTTAGRVVPFGSSAALLQQYYCCLHWPGGRVSSLQTTHTPQFPTRWLGDSLVCLN